ncbi:isoprenylcysteine carboxylmethyltransferase family protein [Aureimonas leprariae]|uniref:Isoprenylcysteine carboxylmethyltransferase family protein n=1 Tax=Plantimonas leprariae TaxID=2615207 RepID=A0A7V7PPJ0_9HYPH|nr:isoprenylcysteine carboxylmethyltransferase family protein [Aureimonas leprariae]
MAVAYGLLCHASFAIGVATMIAAMFFGMSRSLGTVTAPWWPVADAALLLQFPLAHSLLLTPVGGRMLKRLAPDRIAGRLATTTYVIVASLQVLLLFALWTPSGVVWWRATGPSLAVLCVCYAASWLLLLKSILDAGISVQAGSLGWWSVFRDRAPRFPPMPTRGLFRVVRQPIYVSFSLTVWTVPTWTPDQFAVAVFLTAYCLAAPLLKERRFRRRFGDGFETYARQVPYWLPWPRPPRSGR